MSRNRITRPKTLRKLSTVVGFNVVGAFARGGTDHCVTIWGKDGRQWYVYKDGSFEEIGKMQIVIPHDAPELNVRIIRACQLDIPILESPIGSNRSPEIDAFCRRFGVPLGSAWCALWAAAKWQDSGAEIPPTIGNSHPAKAESWRVWALQTGRFSHTPIFGGAVLYGANGQAPAVHIAPCVVSLSPILMDLEGNTSETGFSREGELTELKRVNMARLIGYVSPTPIVSSI